MMKLVSLCFRKGLVTGTSSTTCAIFFFVFSRLAEIACYFDSSDSGGSKLVFQHHKRQLSWCDYMPCHFLLSTTSGASGGHCQSYEGRVITVKFGDYTRRIGIADAIRVPIKSAFRLKTKRTFWLEDEDHVYSSLSGQDILILALVIDFIKYYKWNMLL
ncbi:hypothetical protein PTKIN_Ptkin06aG0216100 [Pterospermum kingtungense]